MSSLVQMIASQLGGSRVSEISRRLGTDESATQNAVAAALPLLMGALAKNASRPEGAEALHRALSRDHDGGVLDDLPGFLANPDLSAGNGILKHALGAKRSMVESGIGKAAGVDSSKVAELLPMLAPLVMGALGKAQRENGLDAASLAGMLSAERQQEDARQGSAGLLGALLDRDGDGQIADDISSLAKGVLGGMFDHRR